jgi:large subunit ribosomal protein L9
LNFYKKSLKWGYNRKVGRRYDVKEVAGGYARNYLVPNQLAEIATDANQKAIKESQRHQQEQKEKREKQLAEDLKKLAGKKITLEEKASETGSLYAGIGKDEIISKLRQEESVELEEEHLALEGPIKELGEHQVAIHVGEESAEVTVKVEQKSGTEESGG